MNDAFDKLQVGEVVAGANFAVTRETIRAFCDASLDYNPLHLDDDYMAGSFGKTSYGGIIMHGMTNFGLITRMLTDWSSPLGGLHRRLETRWRAPVRPGDTLRPTARISGRKVTELSRWITLDIEVRNQRDEIIATGEALAEFPHDLAAALHA